MVGAIEWLGLSRTACRARMRLALYRAAPAWIGKQQASRLDRLNYLWEFHVAAPAIIERSLTQHRGVKAE
jgi:hypothetical protein